MIPDFNDFGVLPAGIHPATLDEIDQRFGRASELRRVQLESVRWMVELAAQAGVQRIILNGSFVTDIIEPNDVDCLLLTGPGFPANAAAETELRKGLPFLDISLVRRRGFNRLVRFFSIDRLNDPKGMVEVKSWSLEANGS